MPESEFYVRQKRLPGWGDEGQLKLEKAKVLVVGAGGLGVPVLQYLVGAGIGVVGIVDYDLVEPSNLHRQPLYTWQDVGLGKAKTAANRLSSYNPDVRFEVWQEPLSSSNVGSILSGFDLAVDCTDNLHTRFALHDACLDLRVPLVSAAVHQFDGQLEFWDFGPNWKGGCLRCRWPEEPSDSIVESCARSGVPGPIVGAMGSFQAAIAIEHLLGFETQSHGATTLVTLSPITLKTFKHTQRASCACQSKKKGESP